MELNDLSVDDSLLDGFGEVVEVEDTKTTEEFPDTIEETTEETPDVEEEESTEEVEESDENTEEDTTVEEGEQTIAEIWRDQLIENGILEDLSAEEREEFAGLDEETQTEKLLEYNNKSIINQGNKVLQEYIQEWPEELKIIEDAYRNGVDINNAIKLAQEAPTIYNPMTESEVDVDLEKNIVLRGYKAKLGDDEAAKYLMEKDMETGLLTEKAKEFSEKDNKAWTANRESQVKASEEAAKAREQAYLDRKNKFEEYVKNSKEIIPGIKLSTKDKEEIVKGQYDLIQTKDGYTTQLQMKLNEKPLEADALMNFLIVKLDVLNNPSNFEKIFKVGATKQTKSVLRSAKNSGSLTTKKANTRTASKGFSLDGLSTDNLTI